MRHNAILLLFAALALMSCERDAKIPLPETEPVMVIASFLSPGDTSVLAYVNLSNPIWNPTGNSWELNPIHNASVRITGPGNQVSDLVYNQGRLGFESMTTENFFVPGGQYSIQVTHPEYPTVTATTIIPIGEGSVQNAVLDIVQVSDFGYLSDFVRFRYELTDPEPGVYNYYKINYYEVYSSEEVGDVLGWQGSAYAEDSQFSGGIKKMEDRFYFNNIEPGQGVSISYVISVLTCSEEYYKYHKTVETAGWGGGPFSEPVIVYSNAIGGLGILGGYRRKDFPVNF
jgi:hypothetical protein